MTPEELRKMNIPEMKDLARKTIVFCADRIVEDYERTMAPLRELARAVGMTVEEFLRAQRGERPPRGGNPSTTPPPATPDVTVHSTRIELVRTLIADLGLTPDELK